MKRWGTAALILSLSLSGLLASVPAAADPVKSPVTAAASKPTGRSAPVVLSDEVVQAVADGPTELVVGYDSSTSRERVRDELGAAPDRQDKIDAIQALSSDLAVVKRDALADADAGTAVR